ncbi:MAG TPA: 3-isopropylmalate dehydratase, partial [Thermodesulfobacteriota bacterium]
MNTDLHASSKYRYAGKDLAFLAEHAFEDLAPGLAARVAPGDVLVAGRDFGANSSREQAIDVIRAMGFGAIVARSFGRQFFRNAVNNGLVVVECDTTGIEAGDLVEINLR